MDITRRLRPRGPPGWAIWLGFVIATVYGFGVVCILLGIVFWSRGFSPHHLHVDWPNQRSNALQQERKARGTYGNYPCVAGTPFNDTSRVPFDTNCLMPAQAEADRILYAGYVQSKNEEAEIMKDVPGWVTDASMYKTRKMPSYLLDVEAPIKKQ